MKRSLRAGAFLLGLALMLAIGVGWVGATRGVRPSPAAALLLLQDFSLLDVFPSRQRASDYQCSSRASLEAEVRPGPSLERHRHSLELTAGYDGSAYVIVNSRTGFVYHWGYEGPNNTAQAVFGVPTGFAISNPGWEGDPWLLLYDCS